MDISVLPDQDKAQALNHPRAMIFFFDGWLSVSSSVLGAARELQNAGYTVEIFFTHPIIDILPPELPDGVILHEHFPRTRAMLAPIIEFLRHRRMKKLSHGGANDTVRQTNMRLRAIAKGIREFLEIPQFALFCRRRIRHAPDLAVAVDMNSLAAMDWILPRTTPFVYWGLEVTMLDEIHEPFTRWMKRHELKRLNQARAVINQGPVRRALLEKDLKKPITRYVAIPNSPSQPMPDDLRDDYFSSRFSIPENSWIVLHSGFISSSLLSLEIAQTVEFWPEDFTLVFHERQQRDPQEPYIQAVAKAGGDRTFFSLNPVPLADVDRIYAGADIGLVCYEVAELNKTLAWASSGKLPYYLRHGMPVIIVTPDCPSLITEWHCGVWVTDVRQIGDALVAIAGDYARYSMGARQAYETIYDFAKGFQRLLAIIGDGPLPRP
jgi:hypothetical protein